MTQRVFHGWIKSSRSNGGNDNCVEVAVATDGSAVGVRDSKDPTGPLLVFTPMAWSAYLDRLRAGNRR
ncbi:DUF397 domain-containing protein [Micromonospora sp. NPDC049679]|uniref:DUF397 domain-containing protein n=1 Tax=Micromonospora sp. NPDC049679 TaxID=3155920 RepID=UPI0033C71F6E